MAKAHVVRKVRQPSRQATVRAAQYVRMSTDSQKYSIENQSADIAAYAARRHITIVRTYTDAGRSGVRIVGRYGLQDLIQDVQLGRANYDCVLVYDVSRWGRFQDVDESAYYEFICKRAGVVVHYCADDFENDGSLTSTVLKTMKRAAAADYSKQLSKKVFQGQCHVVTLGHWRGGPAGFGLRRRLVDEYGKPQGVLEYGQRKGLKSQHTILVPGPKFETRIVRKIFTSFAIGKKTRSEIAAELNVKGVLNACGNPWTMLTISNTLKNEAYIGNVVFNRRSQKLGEKQVKNPQEMWVRRDAAFAPIIEPRLFAKVQKRLAELDYGRTLSDKELIGRLKGLLRRRGRLSLKLMMTTKGVPHCKTYSKRFGSLANAFRLAGFEPESRYCYKETAAKVDQVMCAVAQNVMCDVEGRGRSITFIQELYLLAISGAVTVSVAMARRVSDGRNHIGQPRWEVRKIKFERSDFVLVVRMDSTNTKIKDYFLLLTANLPRDKEKRIRVSNRAFGEFKHDTLTGAMSALFQRLNGRTPRAHSAQAAEQHVTMTHQKSERPRAALMERR